MDNQPLSANQQLLAILVDRYLRDHNFSQTRTTFRNEAFFLNSTMIDDDDKLLVNVLSLDKILDDLILLNDEKKMMLNERLRTQKLLQCMESVMYCYYKSVSGTLPQTKLSQPQSYANSAVPPTTGVTTNTTTPVVPQSINNNARTGNFSTRVKVDQERFLMERERYQINLLVFRMQSLISNYNGAGCLPITNILMSPLLPNANSVVVPQPKLGNRTPTGTITLPETNLPKPPLPLQPNANSAVLPTGVTTPSARFLVPQAIITDATTITTTQKTPNVLSAPPSINAKNGNFSAPVMSVSNRKRKDTEATDATSIGKKSCGRPPSGKVPVQGQNTLPQSNNVVNKQTVSQPEVSIPINLPVPKTPTRTTSCQSDTDISHTEFFCVPPCNGEATPTSIESLPITNILVPPPRPNAKSSVVPQPKLGNRTPTGVNTITTPLAEFLVPQSINIDAMTENVSTPMMSVSKRKGKDTEVTDAPSIGKKSHGRSCSGKISAQGQNTLPQPNNVVNKQIVCEPSSATQSLAGNILPRGPQVQGSSVVISLPVPKTPTRTTSCQSESDIFDIEFFRGPPCNSEATPNLTNRVIVSPQEQMDYIKSSNCSSPDKTDSDKGSKSDFDASDMLESLDKPLPNEISTYESNKQNDLPELANLTFDDDNYDLGTKFSLFDDDDMGVEFSFDEEDPRIFADSLNDDQDLPCKGVNFSDHPISDHSNDNASRFSQECEGEQVICELLPSTVAKVLSEKDMNIQGPNSLTAVESFKKCTTNLSTKRNHWRSFDKENC